MLDETLSSFLHTYASAIRGIRHSGWQFAFAYRGLASSMNNNDPGYVNYEAIIHRRRRGRGVGDRWLLHPSV